MRYTKHNLKYTIKLIANSEKKDRYVDNIYLFFLSMKKLYLFVSVGLTIVVSACAKTITNIPEISGNVIDTATQTSFLSGKVSQYPFTRKMEKPTIEEAKNIEYMQNGFKQKRTKNFGKADIDTATRDELKKCPSITINSVESWPIKKATPKELEQGVELVGEYNAPGLDISLTQPQKSFLDSHGWIAFKPNEVRNMRTADVGILEQEERALYYQKIWGIDLNYKRYPYNTVFITTDMLLHLYHKFFANALRYYEESTARTIMKNLTENMFNKFSKLAQDHQKDVYTPYYDFITAYRAIPYALFVPEEDIQKAIDKKLANEDPENMNFDTDGDISTDNLKLMIQQRLESIITKIPTTYQQAVKKTLKNILDAQAARAQDEMIVALGSINNSPMNIQQDYTQFTPRSHYTDNSLLKSYFMGMKRFMREKMYFNDPLQSKIALLMIKNMQNEDLTNFNMLYSFILKLIGADDDVNIQDIQWYLAKQWRTTDDAIINNVNQTTQDELKTLRPQKIISTHYQTASAGAVTEQQAKDETAGFVFFWEKFTIDSWMFDRMTAGSAEKESTYKPSVQTSLMVPELLINTGVLRDIVNLWMQQAKTKYGITDAQVAGYDKAKQEIQSELWTFDFWVSTYHQWLNGLWWLVAKSDPNAPYFMLDPLYEYKNINTIQGSYTELKHDTLLYVKQAYAEMWWAWMEDCSININPPALPVPKGYVEPNIDLIDSLLKLTDETKDFFKDDESFLEFTKFLFLVRDIAIKQTKNEVIDDESFESLRLYYNTLIPILFPKKVIPGDNDFISALIADIFTSENNWPLYIATGRPYLLITTVKDNNGTRAVIWPIYSTYEFYGSDEPIQAEGGRYTDDDRQKWLDALKEEDRYTIPMKKLLQY